MRLRIDALIVVGLCSVLWGGGETWATWSFELFSGAQYNIPMPLTIRQDGSRDLSLLASYDSEPFDSPIYYAWRIGWWKDASGWELEHIHAKIFLRNGPDEVQNFEISHGYNLFLLNRAWQRYGFHLHVGLGMVVSHPETTVRSKKHATNEGLFNAGYYISGPTSQVALGRRVYLWRTLFAVFEGKFTASFARVPIAEGNADVPNLAIHGLFGVGAAW